MAMERVYTKNFERAMSSMVRGSHPPAKVTLLGRKYPGTKVMPFETFGVTAALEVGGKVYMGTGIAPLATSGGVREPEAIDEEKFPGKILETRLKHLAMLESVFKEGARKASHHERLDLLNAVAVDSAVLELDKKLAAEYGLKNPRPTSGIGSEVATAATIAMLSAQAAFFELPPSLAMRAILMELQGKNPDAKGLFAPLPKFNIINCGKHGAKDEKKKPYVELQETKIAPIGAKNFEEAVFMGIEVLEQIIELSKGNNLGGDIIGFEAGISPALKSPEQVYEMAAEAIEKAHMTGKVVIAADAAASEFSGLKEGTLDKYLYRLYPGQNPLDAEQMVRFWEDMVNRYKILSIEDGMHSEDTKGWELLMKALGNRIEIQGDDLFVTDAEEATRLKDCANSILIKPNQAGSIVRTLRTIAAVRGLGYTISPSHRSGKVPGGYGIIPELCLGTQAEWIKPGAPRRERQGFINNVLTQIAELEALGIHVGYAGPVVAERFGLQI